MYFKLGFCLDGAQPNYTDNTANGYPFKDVKHEARLRKIYEKDRTHYDAMVLFR